MLGVAYNILIRRGGELEWGRPLTRVGAHCRGWNTRSVGVALCFAGDPRFSWGQPTRPSEEQLDSLARVARALGGALPNFGPSADSIKGHRDTLPMAAARKAGFWANKDGTRGRPWTSGDEKRWIARCPSFEIRDDLFPRLGIAA